MTRSRSTCAAPSLWARVDVWPGVKDPLNTPLPPIDLNFLFLLVKYMRILILVCFSCPFFFNCILNIMISYRPQFLNNTPIDILLQVQKVQISSKDKIHFMVIL